jgi:acyl carrier protein
MVSEKVIEIISATRHIPQESISLDSSFEQLDVTSFDAIEIVFCLEEAFDISIPNEAVANVRSVRDVVEMLERQLSMKATAAVEPPQG